MEIIEYPVTKLAELIARREISSEELTMLYLAQVERVNPKINAIVQLYPERALADARRADEWQVRGEPLGPLHGIPYTLKEVYQTKGDIVTAGSLGLQGNIAKMDATIAVRLREAGAILLGKTNTPEFENACDTDNIVYGQTLNPYDVSRSAGGSSGGAAASVAACCSAFDVGADIGGSLRLPAHYCGLATIRSTPGRVPSTGTAFGLRTGLLGMFATEGPLCRSVDDVCLILSVIQGVDGVDPKVFPSSPISPSRVDRLRIAYFDDDGISKVTPETKRTLESAADHLKAAGAHVAYARPPRMEEALEIFHKVVGSCGSDLFASMLKRYRVPKASSLLEKIIAHFKPYACDLLTFAERWDAWERFRSDILSHFQEFDAFLCPVTPRDAIESSITMWDPDQISQISYSWGVSCTLLPSAVVRAGTSADGLPLGLQIVTPPFQEDRALGIAKEIERRGGGWTPPSI